MMDIGSVFSNSAATANGLSDAMQVVMACAVIVSNVNSCSGQGQEIKVTDGAIKVLEAKGFARRYAKAFGQAFGFQKKRAAFKTTVDEEGVQYDQHRLRWPIDSFVYADASLAETGMMYSFAAGAMAYIDLPAIAMGFASWTAYKVQLNEFIEDIIRRDLVIKASESSLEAAKATAKKDFDGVKKKAEDAAKKAAQTKKDEDKKNKTAQTSATKTGRSTYKL
jgi:hypothetical protein